MTMTTVGPASAGLLTREDRIALDWATYHMRSRWLVG
jgi:hypothetical protein